MRSSPLLYSSASEPPGHRSHPSSRYTIVLLIQDIGERSTCPIFASSTHAAIGRQNDSRLRAMNQSCASSVRSESPGHTLGSRRAGADDTAATAAESGSIFVPWSDSQTEPNVHPWQIHSSARRYGISACTLLSRLDCASVRSASRLIAVLGGVRIRHRFAEVPPAASDS